jgi:hypothetical protein
MNERRYGKFVSILSLIALVLTSYSVAIPLVMIFKNELKRDFLGYSVRFGWILGLVIAIISLILEKRIKAEHAKIFVCRISNYAIGCSLLWIILFFIILLTRGHSR